MFFFLYPYQTPEPLRNTNLQFQRFFSQSPSPWLFVQTWSLPLVPLSQPLQDKQITISIPAVVCFRHFFLNNHPVFPFFFLTYDGFDPFRLRLFLHDLLCLLRNQQLCLLALPAKTNMHFDIRGFIHGNHASVSPSFPRSVLFSGLCGHYLYCQQVP